MTANNESILTAIVDLKNEMKQNFTKTDSQLSVIDKRLSLIEQRLGNIEKWIPVDHKELQYQI